MVMRQVRIGSLIDIGQYDDGDYSSAIETDQPIKAGTPVDPDHVVRLSDITATVLGIIYPVGGLYFSTLSTNPAVLLGFGTWASFGSGQVLVGIDAGDPDFTPVEKTGGNKTSTPNAHGGTAVNSHSGSAVDAHSGTAIADHTKVANKQGAAAGDVVTTENHTVTQPANHVVTQPADHVVTQPSNHAAMSIVQPYIVIYIWKRTA